MPTMRAATPNDAELIAGQRKRMFVDSGQAESEAMQEVLRNFVAWVTPRLADGSYLGWLLEEGGVAVAGAGMWIMAFPPHFLDAAPARAYLLNFYTEPAFRGRGLAQQLLDAALAEAHALGIKVVTLHASKFGKPIYERNGFEPTNEMMLLRG
jgi:GNAT superfamily N-acetyltransferase